MCDGTGDCKISNMIKGVEYITQHADEIDVVNISVETPSPALNRAISASIKAGVTYVVAAGNAGKDASATSPASNPDVISVSAIADSDGKCGGLGPALKSENATDDTFAYFSNFGPTVTMGAPGVYILSTWNNGKYAVDSGTRNPISWTIFAGLCLVCTCDNACSRASSKCNFSKCKSKYNFSKYYLTAKARVLKQSLIGVTTPSES